MGVYSHSRWIGHKCHLEQARNSGFSTETSDGNFHDKLDFDSFHARDASPDLSRKKSEMPAAKAEARDCVGEPMASRTTIGRNYYGYW